MEPQLVQPKHLPYIWPDVADLISKGIVHSNNETTADAFFLPIYTGQQYLWIGLEDININSALVCEVLRYTLRTSLFIHVWSTRSGKDYEPWMEHWSSITDFAKINGCDFIEAKVRKGLARKLKWTDKHSLVTLEL